MLWFICTTKELRTAISPWSILYGSHFVGRADCLQQKNVLVNSRGQAFLTDFGLIAVGDGSTGHLSIQQGGTVQYLAPELLSSTPASAQDDDWPVSDTTREPEHKLLKTTEGDVFAYGRLILAVRSHSHLSAV
jgi:serine/threonine protein kinase